MHLKQLSHAKASTRVGLGLMLTLAVFSLTACISSQGIAPQAKALSASAQSQGLGATTAQGWQPAEAWWQSWGDTTLNALVDRALADHPDLKAAQARVARAQAVAAMANASTQVQVGTGADVTDQHFSSTSIYPPPLGGSTRVLANAQVGASWEWDFFGRHQAALAAALGAQRAAQAEAQAVRQGLAAQVVRAYVALGLAQAQRALAVETAEQRNTLLVLTQERVRAGLDTALEQRLAEGPVPDAQQQVRALDERIAMARHALAALTGQPPEATAQLQATWAALVPMVAPTELRSDAIAQRSDLSAARWRVEAASQEAALAQAQFFPNINLSGFVGLSSMGLNRLLQAGSEQWGAGPAIHLPLFDGGRLRAQLQGKTAEWDAAVEAYNQTLLAAVREVADQLSALQSAQAQREQQTKVLAAAQAAERVALQRWQAGLTNRLPVLQALSPVLAQRRQALELTAHALDAHIGLARALAQAPHLAAPGGQTP